MTKEINYQSGFNKMDGYLKTKILYN